MRQSRLFLGCSADCLQLSGQKQEAQAVIGLTATCSGTALTRTASNYPETNSSGNAYTAARLIMRSPPCNLLNCTGVPSCVPCPLRPLRPPERLGLADANDCHPLSSALLIGLATAPRPHIVGTGSLLIDAVKLLGACCSTRLGD